MCCVLCAAVCLRGDWRGVYEMVWSGILPEWSKGADLRSARRSSAWVQTPQVPILDDSLLVAVTVQEAVVTLLLIVG